MNQPEPSTEFPTRSRLPDGDTLIYDGHCVFCRANMRMLRRIDQGKIGYLSLHDDEVRRRWPELTHDQLMQQIYLASANGRTYGGAAALRVLSRRLIALWPLAPLLHIPFSLPLWQFLYRQVARIRYRFGRIQNCDSGSCRMH